MKVINLIGGANTGKTCTALGLTYQMKRAGLRVKYVPEYAEDMVYEERSNILGDQLYILAKQNRRLHRLRDRVDWVVTDSPLLFGLVYASPSDHPELGAAIRKYWDSYDNVSFLLPRDYSFRYDPVGRVQQSHEEAHRYDILAEHYMPADTHRLELGRDYITQILETLKLDVPVVGTPPRMCRTSYGDDVEKEFYDGKEVFLNPEGDDPSIPEDFIPEDNPPIRRCAQRDFSAFVRDYDDMYDRPA
jgi:hypothetical protein